MNVNVADYIFYVNQIKSDTTWLVLIQKDGVKQVLDTSFKQLGTFSPTTNWEKVFAAKDVVTIKKGLTVSN